MRRREHSRGMDYLSQREVRNTKFAKFNNVASDNFAYDPLIQRRQVHVSTRHVEALHEDFYYFAVFESHSHTLVLLLDERQLHVVHADDTPASSHHVRHNHF